jgi:hypothetical protein
MTVYRYAYSIERYTYGRKPERVSEHVVEPLHWEPQPNERGETPGVAGHGLSGYRWRKCRCRVCRQAKAASARAYQQRIKAGG